MRCEKLFQILQHPLPIERPAFAGFFYSHCKYTNIKFKFLETVTLFST